MSIFRKKNNIMEPQEPEPAIDSEPDEGCEPCPGEPLCDIITSEHSSYAWGTSSCEGRYANAEGYCIKEEENK